MNCVNVCMHACEESKETMNLSYSTGRTCQSQMVLVHVTVHGGSMRPALGARAPVSIYVHSYLVFCFGVIRMHN